MEQFANNPQTQLAANIDASTTSVTVNSAAAFPTDSQFRILVDSELMIVTGIAGNTFTVERQQEGTAPAPHTAGTPVTGVLTAGAMAQLEFDADHLPASEWLSSANQALEVILGEPTVTTECAWTAVYATDSIGDQSVAEGRTSGTTSTPMFGGATGHTVASVHIAIANDDTIVHNVTVRLNDNGTVREIVSVVLSPGNSLLFDAEGGDWYVSQGTETTPIPFPPYNADLTIGPNVTWTFLPGDIITIDPTVTWPSSLVVTNETGDTLERCGTLKFLNTTGGINFLDDGGGQANVFLVAYQGCTTTNPGVIGGVPPAAANQNHYALTGDGTWDTPLFVVSALFNIGTPGQVDAVHSIIADEGYFRTGPSATSIDPREVGITLALPITKEVRFDEGNPPSSTLRPPRTTADPPTGTNTKGAIRVWEDDSTKGKLFIQVQDSGGGSGSTWKKIGDSTESGVLTTTGDVLTYGSAYARLGIGADATLMMADAAQSTGNKWVALSQDATVAVDGKVTVQGLKAIAFNGTVATPSTGDVITYDGTNYVAAPPSGGNASVSCILYTGTSVASPGTVLFSYSSANGIHGSLSFKNTGGTNDLSVLVGYTDKQGTTTTETIPLGHGAVPLDNIFQIDLDAQRSAIGIYPPLTAISVTVQDAVAGNHSTYSIAAGLVK